MISVVIYVCVIFLIFAAVVAFNRLSDRAAADARERGKQIADKIVGDACHAVFENVQCDPDGCIDQEKFDRADIPFFIDLPELETCDRSNDIRGGAYHIRASYRGMPVELCDLNRWMAALTDGSEKRLKSRTERKYFDGQWLIADLGTEFPCDVRIVPSTRELRKQLRKKKLRIEDEAFDDQFVVTADDPGKAFQVLTPWRMKRILQAAKEADRQLSFAFLRDGTLHIAANSAMPFFGAGPHPNTAEEFQACIEKRLHWFAGLAEDLRAEKPQSA